MVTLIIKFDLPWYYLFILTRDILVALGASAGGLEALNSFFYNVPEDSDYTYLIVQHLSSDHKSLMAELLAKKTKIPVTEIQQNTDCDGVSRGTQQRIVPGFFNSIHTLSAKVLTNDWPHSTR